jgi:superfamily II RNA helicase
MEVLTGPYQGGDNSSFTKFPFELDHFQKHAIISIDQSKNVLVTAFTGSGKTLVAEYATMRSLERGKKIIYTSPIKSLSNQKFYEFKQKFSDASVGILTGDIKFNPFSNITIMTTEILRNMLVRKQHSKEEEASSNTDEVSIDLENEVDTVVFDEIHYINDKDRGKVWEECLIMLPKHIQLVLLSATIDRAEEFAQWLYKVRERPIALIPTFKRYVPLKHYYYFHGASKEGNTLLDTIGHKLMPLLDESGKFQTGNYEKMITVKRNYDKLVGKQNYGQTGMLNPLVTFLTERNLCPALFFVFSRKKCEQYASAVTQSLNNSQEQALVEKIITQELMKLSESTRQSYVNLPQFLSLKRMLIKGVSVHHSGLIPIFKELIEILFSKKLVKVLFATETFAVGVNMPTKTVLYTELTKRDNNGYRMLMSNEYTQMSGRAGRRGIDDIGHVVLLPNLFQDVPTVLEVERMMLGKSQRIQSKFTIDYLFVLKQQAGIAYSSLLSQELMQQTAGLTERLSLIQRVNPPPHEDVDFFREYDELKSQGDEGGIIRLSKKAEKDRTAKINEMQLAPLFKQRYKKYCDYVDNCKQIETLQEEIYYNESYIEYYMDKVTAILVEHNYIENATPTLKGVIATKISECNPLLLTEMLVDEMFDGVSEPEIAAVLSVFLKEDTSESKVNLSLLNVPSTVKLIIGKVTKLSNHFADIETHDQLYMNMDWTLGLSMIEIAYAWAKGENYLGKKTSSKAIL